MNAPVRLCPRCNDREKPTGAHYCDLCWAAYMVNYRSLQQPETMPTKLCPKCQTGYRLADQPYCRNCQTAYMREWRKIRLEFKNATVRIIT